MKYLDTIFIITSLFVLSCGTKYSSSEEFICSPETMPKYDYRATIKEEMTPQLDSLLRIEKRRDVFKPCRKLIYQAIFLSKDDEIISEDNIAVTPTGRRWEYQPEKQDEIRIEYEFYENNIEDINSFQLNKKLVTNLWQSNKIVGVIENIEQIWMHPFRGNQYNFTEVAPFPQVNFPLKLGKNWTDIIHPKDGWGDWSNMKVR